MRLQICDRQHEEVCYDSVNCPMCELVSTIEEQDAEISKLLAELEKAQESKEVGR